MVVLCFLFGYHCIQLWIKTMWMFVFISLKMSLIRKCWCLFCSSRVLQTMWSPLQRRCTSTALSGWLSKFQTASRLLRTPALSPCKASLLQSASLNMKASSSGLWFSCVHFFAALPYGTPWWGHPYSAYRGVLSRLPTFLLFSSVYGFMLTLSQLLLDIDFFLKIE